MNKKLTGLVFGTALATFAFSACDPGTNTNTTNKTVSTNSNTAIVVNNNSTTGTNTVTTTNTTTNTSVTREDYDKKKTDYEKQAKDAGSKIGQGADDLWIWTKTKTALAAADDLRDSTINVDVDKDVITLRGTVATAAQKTKAGEVAKGIDGQKGVTNDLQVKAGDSATNQLVNGSAANTHSNANTKK